MRRAQEARKGAEDCFEDIEVPRDDSLEVDLDIPEIDLKIAENELTISGLDIWNATVYDLL